MFAFWIKIVHFMIKVFKLYHIFANKSQMGKNILDSVHTFSIKSTDPFSLMPLLNLTAMLLLILISCLISAII